MRAVFVLSSINISDEELSIVVNYIKTFLMSYSFIKRFFDIIFSIHALLPHSIFILIIFILFLTAEGEIFY